MMVVKLSSLSNTIMVILEKYGHIGHDTTIFEKVLDVNI